MGTINGNLLVHYHFTLFSGPVLLYVGGVWVRRWYKGLHKGEPQRNLISIIFLLVGLAHLVGVYQPIAVDLAVGSARDLGTVDEIQVERITDESLSPNGPKHRFENAALLADGLALLKDAKRRSRNHESFSDGYRIYLKYADAEAYSTESIVIFRKSSRFDRVFVIKPYWGESNGSEFTCDEFRKWFESEIEIGLPE